jgi:MoaD family protein
VVKVRVRLYARLVELVGVSNLELEMPGKPRLKDLLKKLSERFGEDFHRVVTSPSDEYGHYFLAILINERDSTRLEGRETELKENDIIKIIPPILGG